MSDEPVIRYTFQERLNHWLAGITYLYLLLSGLAFYSPYLDWFTVHGFPLNAYDESRPPGYSAWWGLRALPRLNTDFPGVREYARFYGLNQARLQGAAKHALVMHPGPMNRGVEISSEVADSASVILDQVTNGVAVRMAVMFLLSGGSKAEA